MISIVVPCYNLAEYLPEALNSVLAQTYPHWECIVVNDGSPDNTSEVVRQFISSHPDRSIRLIEKLNGLGPADARNVGIRSATHDLILPLDADDIFAPSFLEKTVAVMLSNPSVNVVYSDLQAFGDRHDVWGNDVSRESFLRWNLLPYASLFRRELWQRAGGYDSSVLYSYEDWDFWLSCLEQGMVAHRIRESLLLYRVRSNGRLQSNGRNHGCEIACLKTLHPDLYPTEVREAHQTISQMDPTILDQRIARFPELPMPYLWRGLVREASGMLDLAKTDYEQSLSLNPLNWQAAERILGCSS